METQTTDQALLQLIEARLREGASIDISGMGSFVLDDEQKLVFRPTGRPLVFLSYAQEDRPKIKKLFRQLENAGLDPWMDCQRLLPGQNWPRSIQQTIEVADFYVSCFSKHSTTQRGHFQGEMALALEVATEFPEDDFYFIPIRLDECELPRRVARTTHYVDLFPNWDRGVKKLITALRKQHTARRKRCE